IEWRDPFRAVPAREFGGPWAALVERVLEAPQDHVSLIVTTVGCGDVAVHAASPTHGVRVGAGVSETAVAPIAGHRAASQVVEIIAGTGGRAENRTDGVVVRSLFDLPLGNGHAWTISEQIIKASGSPRQERFHTLMPCWDAQNEHRLLGVPVGFDEAADALAQLCHPDFPYDLEALQVA